MFMNEKCKICDAEEGSVISAMEVDSEIYDQIVNLLIANSGIDIEVWTFMKKTPVLALNGLKVLRKG